MRRGGRGSSASSQPASTLDCESCHQPERRPLLAGQFSRETPKFAGLGDVLEDDSEIDEEPDDTHGQQHPGSISGSTQTMASSHDDAAHVEHANPSPAAIHTRVLKDDAIRAHMAAEHQMSFVEGVRAYPKAIAWSAFFSLGVIMMSFDPQVLGNLYAVPAFQRDFGYLFEGRYIVSAAWQSGLSMGNPIGQCVGALAAGYPMEWYGMKKTFAACVIATGSCIFIQFFARSLPVLLVGELLGGLILGSYAVIAPAYASEVVPLALRGTLTSYINLCFVIGQLLANGVTKGTSTIETHWAYSLPFALQWVWVAIILPVIPFAPESPWWLVRQNRLADAEHSLKRLSSPTANTKAALAMIVETDRLEQAMQAGSTYRDCFKSTNWRRTEISIGVYATQVLSGIYLISYGTYFFTLAGLPTSDAFSMSIGFLALGFVGVLVSWVLIQYFGRRTIYNSGLAVLAVLQLLIGILACIPSAAKGVQWSIPALTLLWNLIYSASIGPLCFVLLSEVSATKLRAKTIAIATAVQAVLGIGMTVAIPYLINPDEANLGGKLGFVFGGCASLCFVWAYLRVPETKGRTFTEMDMLFERGVKGRDFGGYRLGGEG